MWKLPCQVKKFHKLRKTFKTKVSRGSGFFTHRACRIGASLSGAECRTNPAQPSQSLMKSICCLFKVNTKAVTYGCKHEDDAIKAYEATMEITHTDFKISKCEVVISQELPWIHATPDFLVSCSSCGLGCGEVKCPMILPRQMWLAQLCFKEDFLYGKGLRQSSTKRKAATIISKSSNSCLHCLCYFVLLQKLHKKGSINFYCHWKDVLLTVFLRPVLLKFDGTLSPLLCSLGCHSWRFHVRDCVYIFGVSEIKSRHAVNIQFIPRLCRFSRNKMSAAYLFIFKLSFGRII